MDLKTAQKIHDRLKVLKEQKNQTKPEASYFRY